MSADQVAKLVHQFILLTNAFQHPVDKPEEKTHACHPIGRAMSQLVRRWLTRRSWIYS